MSFKENSTEEVLARIKRNDDIEIIDVREQEEWESGHIEQAKHIPLSELLSRLQEVSKDRETIIVCRSGNRSARASEFLDQQGYNVINMTGGMLNWNGEVKVGK